MTQPGNTVTKFIRRKTAAGVAVTGKVLADFTPVGWHHPAGGAAAVFTTGSTITEIGSGIYAWTFTMPSTSGHFGVDIAAASGTDIVEIVMVGGELEANDLDAITAAVSRPLVTVTGQGTIGQITPITLVAYRYRKVRFSFTDEDGVAIDMTDGVAGGYTNYKLSTRGRSDQTLAAAKQDAFTGTPAGFSIVGASGYVDVTFPESMTFFTALTEGVSVVDIYEMRFELVADLVDVAGQTVPLVQSSPLFLTRRELGT